LRPCLRRFVPRRRNSGKARLQTSKPGTVEGTVDQTLSLDPKAARQAIEDATFAANRLCLLLSQLQVRCGEVRDQEQAKAWLAEYDVMKRKRDAPAEELREVIPEVENNIVDLFVRITDNNEELSALHQARPAGVMEHLLSAELHARGLDRGLY
jgi:hypothetical protein